MKIKRVAYKVAVKYLSEISEMIDPSDSLKKDESAKPSDLIMQKDKVLYHHLKGGGDTEDFEKTPQFDKINYLVRYYIDNEGKKRKKDSF